MAATATAATSPHGVPAIDPATTAVVIMDYENGILTRVVQDKAVLATLIERANTVLSAAREAKSPVVYVRVAQTANYSSVDKRNKILGGLVGSGLLLDGTDDTAIHSSILPKTG